MDLVRLTAAAKRTRQELLAERSIDGPWVGELAASAVSTATAVSAFACYRNAGTAAEMTSNMDDIAPPALIRRGVMWLLARQRDDGGWGDTDLSFSNVATTLLVQSALTLAGQVDPAAFSLKIHLTEPLRRATSYLERMGGVSAVRQRYGQDKTFAVPILTNAALAGLVPWSEVSALPFELAVPPQRVYRFLRLPVVSYAIPALVAIGQAVFHFRPPRFPWIRWWRRAAIEPSLRVLERMQPPSGGYLEAIPLTSFVVMSLASIGRPNHAVTQAGLQFLRDTIRSDGSWPIDTNLATWNTSLAVHALGRSALTDVERAQITSWLLSCQHTQIHPFTGAAPGGWGWTNLSGAVPDADDTPGALLALAELGGASNALPDDETGRAVDLGLQWLLDLQNRDGGWPTFCRGWGRLPFDRSGTDLTAHALRAIAAWRSRLEPHKVESAVARGFRFLARTQTTDGTWLPLWFGNQHHPREDNPVYGTAKVLLAYVAWDRMSEPAALRAVATLTALQNLNGSWGAGPEADVSGASTVASNEESALAVEALLPWSDAPGVQAAIDRGLFWLIKQVETEAHRDPQPIGFYFAKLWYHEKLYPLTFVAATLRRACERFAPTPDDSHAKKPWQAAT